MVKGSIVHYRVALLKKNLIFEKRNFFLKDSNDKP